MNECGLNLFDYILIVITVIACAFAIIVMTRNAGKCAYCSHADSCPFKKGKKNDSK